MNAVNEKAIDILLTEACVPIRWRVEREILGRAKPETVSLNELLTYSRVRENLDYLTGKTDVKTLVGMDDSTLENACGKLHDLGIVRGFPELDSRVEPYLEFLDALIAGRNEGGYRNASPVARDFIACVVSGFLSLLGFSSNPPVKTQITRRLEKLADFIDKFDPLIFYTTEKIADPSIYWGAKTKVVNPQWFDDGIFPLPTMYDAVAWSYLSYEKWGEKIEKIIPLIFSGDYQELPPAYNMILSSTKRHMLTVPLIKLPGYKNVNSHPRQMDRLLRILNWLTPFPGGRSHPWFRKNLEWLEGMVDERGLCRVPKDALKHEECGSWFMGMRPSLEAKPRTYEKRVLEATFRLLLIKEAVDGKPH